MESRRIVESSLAVAGLWLLVRQVPDFATTLVLISTSQLPVSAAGPNIFSFQAIHFFVSAATGAALFFSRRALARWIHPSESTTSIDAESILTAGIGILGAYFVVTGLLNLIPLLNSAVQAQADAYIFWSGLISLLLGAFLFIGAPGVMRLWRAARGGYRSDA